jgi:hypothetical protein
MQELMLKELRTSVGAREAIYRTRVSPWLLTAARHPLMRRRGIKR